MKRFILMATGFVTAVIISLAMIMPQPIWAAGARFIKATVLQMSATSLPSTCTNGQVRYDTSTSKLKLCGSNSWSDLGGSGGGGINYHDDFEADNINKVDTYDDGGTTEPVDGTGDAGSKATTASLNTSSPISGTSSYQLEKPASDVQGQGWSIDSDTLATLETDGSEAVWFNFSYTTPGAYASGDYTVWVYRVGSNTLEALNTFQGSSFTNDLPAAPNGGRYSGWVTPSSSDTELRLIIHVGTTSTTAMNMQMDRVSIGPAGQVQSAIIGDWENAGTITFDGTTTAPTKGTTSTDILWLRRVGGNLEGRIEYVQSGAGVAGSGDYLITLPSGYAIDTAKLTADATVEGNGAYNISNKVGSASWGNTTANVNGHVYVANSTQLKFAGTWSGTGTNGNDIGVWNPSFFSLSDSGIFMSATFSVPITGWSSGNAMSTAELSVRGAKARYSTDAGQSIPNNTITILDFEDKSYDSHNAVTTGGSWKFTAPSTGYYSVNASILFQAATTWNLSESLELHLFKNGTRVSYLSRKDNYPTGATNYAGLNGSDEIYLEAGDYIDIRAYQASGAALSIYTVSDFNFVSITQQPDLTVIGVNGVNESRESKATATWLNYTITASQWGDLTSLSLTPGTWDISALASFKANGAITTAAITIGISTISGNDGTGLDVGDNVAMITPPPQNSGNQITLVIPNYTQTLANTTTYYLKANANASITNLQAVYKISARRIQ